MYFKLKTITTTKDTGHMPLNDSIIYIQIYPISQCTDSLFI